MGQRFRNLKLKTDSMNSLPQSDQARVQNGLSKFQRFVVKNVFDTQTPARKAYFKRLGYETNPDATKYRPAGHEGKFKSIEPDDGSILPAWNIFTQEGRDELKADFTDVGFDTLVQGPAITLGGIAGGTAGSAVPVAGTVVGTGAGAVAGNVAAETMKKGVGMFLLDDDVPIDMQELMFQSLSAGVFASAGTKLANMAKNWRGLKAEKVRDSLKQAAIQKSGGRFNAKLMDDFVENPQNYTPEAVKGSTRKLLNMQRELFGTSEEKIKSTKQLTGGVLRDVIEPLNKQAKLEMEKLSATPEADFSVDALQNLFNRRLKLLKQKPFPTPIEEKAIDYFDTQATRLRSFAEKSGKQQMPFEDGRDMLKSLQFEVLDDSSTAAIKGNPVAASVVKDFRELADKKAGKLGSSLPEINRKRKRVLDTYKNMRQTLTDNTLRNAYTGRDSISKQKVDDVFVELSDVAGRDFASEARSLQFQAAVESVYDSPNAFGSGSVISEGVKEGFSKGSRSAAAVTGVLTPLLGFTAAAKVGGTVGAAQAVRGFKQGTAIANPDALVKSVTKINSRIDDLAEEPATGLLPTARQAFGGRSGRTAAQTDSDLTRAVQSFLPAEQEQSSGQSLDPQGTPDREGQRLQPQSPVQGEQQTPQDSQDDPLKRFKTLKLNTNSLGQ